MTALQTQLDRIRRLRWLVVAVMALAVSATVVYSLLQEPVYTGKAALTVSSLDRSPEQDAVLAQGYVEYFNQESSKQVLRAETALPEAVTFSARTSASSPIVYIEATASSADQATTAASKLAGTFRENINTGVRQASEHTIHDLSEQISANQDRLRNFPASPEERALIGDQIQSLQNRIIEIQADPTNLLRDLQLTAGVSREPVAVVPNALLALVGGLILGVVAALALASAEDRLVNPLEVRERLGLDTLAVVGGGPTAKGRQLRTQQLKGLANVVSLSDLSRPAILAITAPRYTVASSQVAEAVAFYRAQQGERTLLIRADLDPERRTAEHQGRLGLGDFLAGSPGIRLEPVVVPGGSVGMLVVPAGSSRSDPYALFAPERLADAVAQAGELADLVVIDAPPIVEAAEGQVICASADRTILVVEEYVTRAADAVEACRGLERVHTTLLGVVIARVVAGRATPSAMATLAPDPASGWLPAQTRSDSGNGVRTSSSADGVEDRA